MMEAKDPQQRDVGPFHSWGRVRGLTERSVSRFQQGRRKGEGKGWRNRRFWQVTKQCRCLPTTGSTSAHCRQVWSGLSRTWPMGKQTKPIMANTQTEERERQRVCVWERDCAFMQTTNASCLANMEMSFKTFCNFKCTITYWTQKYSVQLSKIKLFFLPLICNYYFLYNYCVNKN